MTSDSGQHGEVLVVGAGAVGLSTAFALLKAGLSVSVVSAGGVGDGATAANAGLLVPADSLVWPGPENARAVPKTIHGRGHRPAALTPDDRAVWRENRFRCIDHA
jgi:glycine/D-amino acid oxidase-like deaminating enzyme